LESALDAPLPLSLLAIGQLPVLYYLINALILLTLLFVSGMVSGSEVAFFSLDAATVRQLKDGTTSEKKVSNLLLRPKRLLATILILNNFINIAFVTLSTFLSWKIAGTKDPEGVIIVLLTFTVTLTIVYFGEVVPKIYANQMGKTFALFTVPLIDFAFWLFKPLAWVLISMSHVIERRMKKEGYQISAEELNQALELTTSEGTSDEERDILKGIVNFGQLSVKQIMTSRVDITAFDVEMDFHGLMDKINKTGYSRFPVFRETIDKIEGILYNKDLLPYLDEKEHFQWQSLIRPPMFVPESKKIDTLLKDFQEKRIHMAIVVDEYGGTSGLVTLEDVIEEIVGEIRDEFDQDEIVYNKLSENIYVFEGKTTLIDFCKIIEEDPDIFEKVKGESESLGGLILELSSKFPRVGEKVLFDKFVFTVVSVDQKRIKRVRILIKKTI
jgi:gliding motility-associated protein GldE